MRIPPCDVGLVRIVATPAGRLALFPAGDVVPASLLGLAAGRDVWMKQIPVACLTCGQKFPAGQLECELCPACFEAAGIENERLDHAT